MTKERCFGTGTALPLLDCNCSFEYNTHLEWIEVIGVEGTSTTQQFPHFKNPTTIQDRPKETHFTQISKYSCNRTQWVYKEQTK
jgi:hypothetical protein